MSMSVLKASLIVIVPIMFMVSSAVILNAQTPATEGTDELCGLNPGLHAAITSTLASHPPTGYEDTETYRSLMYFWGTVIKDAEWCQNGRMVGVDPDLAERTMRWHYGNASEFMRQYTEMVQGTSTPAPAATPSATPVPAAPAASVWTVGDRYTDGITGTISVQIVTIAVSHNVDSLWESPGLLIRCSSTKPYEVFVHWGGQYMAAGFQADGVFDGYVRWDADTALSHEWNESTSNEATFSRDPLGFRNNAVQSSTVFVRVIDFSNIEHDASFELAGLAGHLSDNSDLCY